MKRIWSHGWKMWRETMAARDRTAVTWWQSCFFEEFKVFETLQKIAVQGILPTRDWGALVGHSGWSPYWWQCWDNSLMITALWGTIWNIQGRGVPGPLPITHHLVTSPLGDVRHWGTPCLLLVLQFLKEGFIWGLSHILERSLFHL